MFTSPSAETHRSLEQLLEKIGEIVLRLHQLTDLETLLSYGVQQIQDLFESDRSLIYQFLPNNDGVVIAEAVKDGWQPLMGQLIYDDCFQNDYAELYRQGRISQIADVEQSDLAPCHITLLTQLQVKANLVVPIIMRRPSTVGVGDEPQLWGLVILHQCSTPRTWSSLAIQVLKQLTLQLGIAIAHLNTHRQTPVSHSPLATVNRRDHFFTHAHDLMAIVDQNGTIILVNPTWQRSLGYASEDIVGSHFFDRLHPDDVAAVQAVFQQHRLTQQPILNCEARCRHHDGSYRWIAWNAVYDNGVFYSTGRDLTQQKQRESAFRQQEERWELALRGTNDGIWDWNIITDELFLSSRWKEMLGYRDDEVEHRLEAWESRVHPDDRPHLQQSIQDHLQRQTPFFEVEQRMRCKDGTYKWVLARAQAVWDDTGRAVRMVGSHMDISDRKHAELMLQEREEILQLLIKYAPANIAMFDRNMNYLMITQRGIEACQLGSIESVLGRSHYDMVPIAAQWQAIHQRCLTGAIETCDESLLTWDDGTQYWTRWEIHPWYKPNQEIGGIILFSEDITTQKQAAQELEHSIAELTRLNQLKDDFLSTVSHELRTPLSNIKMAGHMLELSLKSFEPPVNESNPVHRYLQILKTECQRETQLINDLLDLTQLDADTEPLNFTLVDLSRLLSQLAAPFMQRAQQHQQHLHVDIPDQLLITTDAVYLERMTTELLNNACKYTPAGEHISLTVQPASDMVAIVVNNSGVEITEIERDRIFDKFYRIPHHDPWKYGGTGLGLALTKKMVDRLGGKITVDSYPPGTTTFTIQLPWHTRRAF